MSYANLGHLLRYQAQRLGPRAALRYRKYGLYRDLTWEHYHSLVSAAAMALVEVGVGVGDRVGLVGENSVTWLIADMAILTAGGVNVSPHAPLTARQIQYQLHDADVVWAIVSNKGQLDKLRSLRSEMPALRGIVVFDPHAAGEDALAWESFLQHGHEAMARNPSELLRREKRIHHDSLATVMYTSGTTGNPKGVMLTHGNILSNAEACEKVQPYPDDGILLSWLPYTHIYARTCDHYSSMFMGTTMALSESAETLVEDLAEIKPTNLSSVPRFYEKVLSAVASPDPAETGKRLRRIFGPRMERMSSGGAPLPVPIAEVYIAAGLPLMQGYGLTESSPVISFNSKTHHKIGTVGRAIPGVEIKIAEDGEVLSRGPHIMKGYWKNPEATAETIKDGWLYTGDLGTIDADGFLSITGRKKELMVLSNGKKVVPTYIEGLLITDPCIDQAVVCGEGKNFLTALLVPNWVNVKEALAKEGKKLDGTPEQMANDPVVNDLMTRRCQHALQDVSRMEQIKKFVVLAKPFTVEADELTVSLKMKRNVILKHNEEKLESLYHGDASLD
jgi:long-chain acyl-CoA synthetase